MHHAPTANISAAWDEDACMRTEAKANLHLDHGGPWVLLGGLNGAAQGVKVGVAVLDVLHVPAQGLIALADVLREGDLCVPVNGDPAAMSQSGL